MIDLGRLIELLTIGPAGVLGLEAGRLKAGAVADVTVLDIDRKVRVESSAFRSKSENSPFLGWSLRGAPVMTLVGGRIVHDAR